MISDYYNKTVKTQRLTDITDSEKEDYQDFITELNCLIQPLSDSYQEDLDSSTGKDFAMFCEIADIKEGDKIIDGTDEYSIIGLRKYSDKNNEHHLEVIIRLYKQ